MVLFEVNVMNSPFEIYNDPNFVFSIKCGKVGIYLHTYIHSIGPSQLSLKTGVLRS